MVAPSGPFEHVVRSFAEIWVEKPGVVGEFTYMYQENVTWLDQVTAILYKDLSGPRGSGC